MKNILFLISGLFVLFACQSKEQKEADVLREKITKKADSILLYNTMVTEKFLQETKGMSCEEKEKKYDAEIQKTQNMVAQVYQEQAFLLGIPEDSVTLRLRRSNKVTITREGAECVGKKAGYDKYEKFLMALKLKKNEP